MSGVVLFLSLALGASPCTPAEAAEKTGKWSKIEDDLAFADKATPKTQRASLLAEADRVLAMIREALPELRGIDGTTQRVMRGEPYVKDGVIKYGASAHFLSYYCVPEKGFAANIAGTIRPGGETGTHIYFSFNNLDWLANDRLYTGLKTPKGVNILWVPRTVGTLQGADLLAPDIHRGRRGEEALLLFPEGVEIYDYERREEYVRARIAEILKKPQTEKTKQDIEAFEAVLASMSEEERKLLAVVKDISAQPPAQPVFVSEAEGGRRLGTVNGYVYKAKGDRSAIRMMTVYWTWDLDSPAKLAAINSVKEKLDVKTLKEMLSRD